MTDLEPDPPSVAARLAEASPNPMLAVDERLTLVYANPAAAPLCALLAVQIGDHLEGALAEAIERAWDGPADVEIRANGRVLQVAVSVLDGQPLMFGLVAKDVTEARATEEAVHMAARFPAEAPNPLLRVGRDGYVEYANPPAKALLEDVLTEARLVPAEWLAALTKARLSGSPGVVFAEVQDRTFEMTIAAIPDAAYFYAYGRDVTDERQAQADLIQAKEVAEAASRTKSAFLANMSHELRTPLNAIIGYSELLEEEAEDLNLHDLLPDLAKIRNAGKHLLELINDILDLSKIEAGKMDISIVEFEVDAVVRQVVDTVRPMIEKNGNRFVVDVAAGCGTMRGDDLKVRQVLVNLCSNAGKFTEDGEVRLSVGVECGEADDDLVICVTDTGIGMSDEQLERVFSTFTQADGSTTRRFGGTGLGLAITKRFCDLMGAEIAVESEFEVGTTFRVLLPMRRAKLAKAEASTRASQRPKPHPAGIILVIDDDDMVHELVSRMLEPEGFGTIVAKDAAEGVALAAIRQPSLILLDVVMPGQDGFDTLTQLKADPRCAGIPVVMLSMVDEQVRGRALGAVDYLLKPVEREKLLRCLRAHIGDVRARVVLIGGETVATTQLRVALEGHGCRARVVSVGDGALASLQSEADADVFFVDLSRSLAHGLRLLDDLTTAPRLSAVPVVVRTVGLSPEGLTGLGERTFRVIGPHDDALAALLEAVRRGPRRRAPAWSASAL